MVWYGNTSGCCLRRTVRVLQFYVCFNIPSMQDLGSRVISLVENLNSLFDFVSMLVLSVFQAERRMVQTEMDETKPPSHVITRRDRKSSND